MKAMKPLDAPVCRSPAASATQPSRIELPGAAIEHRNRGTPGSAPGHGHFGAFARPRFEHDRARMHDDRIAPDPAQLVAGEPEIRARESGQRLRPPAGPTEGCVRLPAHEAHGAAHETMRVPAAPCNAS